MYMLRSFTLIDPTIVANLVVELWASLIDGDEGEFGEGTKEKK